MHDNLVLGLWSGFPVLLLGIVPCYPGVWDDDIAAVDTYMVAGGRGVWRVVLELSSPSETYVDIHRHTILIVLPALYIELSL